MSVQVLDPAGLPAPAAETKPGAVAGVADVVDSGTANAPRVHLVKKHPLAIRWMHWINFPVIFMMIWSGLLILWAYDMYPLPKWHLSVPNRITLSRKGITSVYAAQDTDTYPVPVPEYRRVEAGPLHWYTPAKGLSYFRQDIVTGSRLAEGMAWHFTLAWIFTLNGVAYVLYLAFSGEYKHLLPRAESFKEAFLVVFHDLGLYKKPLPPGKFNHAQRIAYTSAIALGFGMVVTGLAIYKPAQLSWLANLLGGYQAARTEHFLITALLLAFFFVHIAQVMRAGWNNFRAMITGYELSRHDYDKTG